jgi:hypothetical protein
MFPNADADLWDLNVRKLKGVARSADVSNASLERKYAQLNDLDEETGQEFKGFMTGCRMNRFSEFYRRTVLQEMQEKIKQTLRQEIEQIYKRLQRCASYRLENDEAKKAKAEDEELMEFYYKEEDNNHGLNTLLGILQERLDQCTNADEADKLRQAAVKADKAKRSSRRGPPPAPPAAARRGPPPAPPAAFITATASTKPAKTTPPKRKETVTAESLIEKFKEDIQAKKYPAVFAKAVQNDIKFTEKAVRASGLPIRHKALFTRACRDNEMFCY